jgi:signal transduction histidine kinase
MKLRTQLFVALLCLVSIAAAGLTAYLAQPHREALSRTTEAKIEMLRDNLRQKAATLARDAALSSTRSVLETDFGFLQSVLSAVAAADPGIAYAMIIDRTGRIVVHSDPARVGSTLATLPDASEATTRDATNDGRPVVEAIAPIRLGREPWGWVLYGLSLAALQKQVDASQQRLDEVATESLRISAIAAGAVLALALVLASLVARRIVRPVAQLDGVVQQVLLGRNDVRVDIQSPREVARLARGFNTMLAALAARADLLRQDRRKIEAAVEEARQAGAIKQLFLSRVTETMLAPLDGLERLQATLVQAFEAVTTLVCTGCGAEFEPEAGEVADDSKPCPSCGAKLQRRQGARLAAEPAEVAQRLAELEARGSELKKLVDDILDFSALDSGKRQLVVEPVELAPLLRAAQRNVPAPEGKRLVWPEPLPTLRLEADRGRLEQAVGLAMELLCQLSRQPNAEIRLEVDPCSYRGSAGVQFVARELGAGLLPEYVESLKAGSAPDVRAILTIMALRRVATMHDGEFSLESIVGRGTTARLVLPATQGATTVEAVS